MDSSKNLFERKKEDVVREWADETVGEGGWKTHMY